LTIFFETSQDLLGGFLEWRIDSCHIGIKAQYSPVYQSEVA
jgi:hypothetical protein